MGAGIGSIVGLALSVWVARMPNRVARFVEPIRARLRIQESNERKVGIRPPTGRTAQGQRADGKLQLDRPRQS
jgi:hypothetical protein